MADDLDLPLRLRSGGIRGGVMIVALDEVLVDLDEGAVLHAGEPRGLTRLERELSRGDELGPLHPARCARDPTHDDAVDLLHL